GATGAHSITSSSRASSVSGTLRRLRRPSAIISPRLLSSAIAKYAIPARGHGGGGEGSFTTCDTTKHGHPVPKHFHLQDRFQCRRVNGWGKREFDRPQKSPVFWGFCGRFGEERK